MRCIARTVHRRTLRKRGFSLAEMVVALAVTVVVMAVVSNVFSITAKTVASGTAVSEVQILADGLMTRIEDDLAGVNPGRSVLVIAGRTQAAALNEDQRGANQYWRVLTGDPTRVPARYDTRFDPSRPTGNATNPRDQFSDPRADILMFFTERSAASGAPPTELPTDAFQRSVLRGTRYPLQVVYGHAAIDQARFQAGGGGTWRFAGDLTHVDAPSGDRFDLSPLPVERWQLVRRATLIEDTSSQSTGGAFFSSFQFTRNEFRRILTGVSGANEANMAADVVSFPLLAYLREFGPLPGPPGQQLNSLALRHPYGNERIAGLNPITRNDRDRLINGLLYPNRDPREHHIATVLENPPGELAGNLSLRPVPACAWFQVEFLLPEDPRNSIDHPDTAQRNDLARWVSVKPGETYVFVPDSEENRALVRGQIGAGGVPLSRSRLDKFAWIIPPPDIIPGVGDALGDTFTNRIVRLWPYAIRVTVRVLDARGRIEEPVVRTLVHRFE